MSASAATQTTRWTDASFVGGHPALDFVNTAGGPTRARDAERLLGYGDLVGWCRHACLVSAEEAAVLESRARGDPAAARVAVEEVRAQREALHVVLRAAIDGTTCPDGARDRVRDDVVAAHRDAELSTGLTVGPAWVVDVDDAGPATPGRRLALVTAALLGDERRRQVRICGRCSWLFLDPSPTRRRRWCSMATCGNRAKAQRHQVGRPGRPPA